MTKIQKLQSMLQKGYRGVILQNIHKGTFDVAMLRGPDEEPVTISLGGKDFLLHSLPNAKPSKDSVKVMNEQLRSWDSAASKDAWSLLIAMCGH